MTYTPDYIKNWNLSQFANDVNDPKLETAQSELRKKVGVFANTWSTRTDYLSDPAILLEALKQYEEFITIFGEVGGVPTYYYILRSFTNENDPVIKGKLHLFQESTTQIVNLISFFELQIAKISQDKQQLFLSDVPLKPYHHFLTQNFLHGKHLLSVEEENILNLTIATSYSQWVRMTSSFISKEEREVLNEDGTRSTQPFMEIASRMNSTQKKVRDTAVIAFNEILLKHRDTAEAELNAVLGYKKTTDNLRHATRPDQLTLLEDEMDTDTVDALRNEVVKRNDISKRYYTLKTKLVGVPTLAYHERNVPYGEVQTIYTFEDAISIVRTVFRNLDPTFDTIVEKLLTEGYVDVYPTKGKRGGACCIPNLTSHSPYVLLNHTNKLQDVLTLAHEFGHAIHSELTRGVQSPLYYNASLATAEVASTFMEDFVIEELKKRATDEERLSLMMLQLNDDVSTIFRQIALYQFEFDLHIRFRNKGFLSHQEIGEIFTTHMSSYMGDAVEMSSGSENWWVYWEHIRYFFYVYTYASGLLISKSLQHSVRTDPAFIEHVKQFLRAGSSKSPYEIFKDTGIDIHRGDFWQNGINEIELLLNQTEELAVKLGHI